MELLKVRNLSSGYGSRLILHHINFDVMKGEIFGIIGPNGSGKSTLLKAISHWLPLNEGSITLNNIDLSKMLAKERAQKIAVLPQISDSQFSYNVENIVMMGRYPHMVGLFKTPTKRDYEVVKKIMKETLIYNLRHQPFINLSGGERQRVLLARALVQEPDLLLLDEPTNHLDIHHQVTLLDLLAKFVQQHQLTVITILHDLNLASLYCDRLMLMQDGFVRTVNETSDVLKEDMLNDIYSQSVIVKEHPSFPTPSLLVTRKVNNNRPLSIDIKKNRYNTLLGINQSIKFFSSLQRESTYLWANAICWGEEPCAETNWYIHNCHDSFEKIDVLFNRKHLGYIIIINGIEKQVNYLIIILDGIIQEGDMLKIYQNILVNYLINKKTRGVEEDMPSLIIGSTQNNDLIRFEEVTPKIAHLLSSYI